MAYQQHSIMVAGYKSPFYDEQSYQVFPLSGTDDAISARDVGNIDPGLTSFRHPEQYVSHGSQQPLHRFLKDQNKLALFNPAPQLPTMAPASLARPTAPLPPPSLGRVGSPVSSHGPTSSSSDPQSLSGDSDYYPDNTPLTPLDAAVLPSFEAQQFDPWGMPSHFCDLVGVSTFPTVSMSDVNSDVPFDTLDYDSSSESMLPSRTFSFESQLSTQSSQSGHYDLESMASQGPVDFGVNRMSTPEDMRSMVKEILIAGPPEPPKEDTESEYPPLASQDDGDDDSVEAPETLPDQEDDEYRPRRWPARTATPARRRNGREKRGAATRLDKAAPKRRRTSHSSGSVSASPRRGEMLPPASSAAKGGRGCPECQAYFKDAAALDAHIKKQHTRPFVCVFNFAGCDSTFASKNEWKRHVSSQHLLLHYWLCTEGACANTKNPPPPPPPTAASPSPGGKPGLRSRGPAAAAQAPGGGTALASPALPNGAIFNRKDLYTQHLRRMHMPAHIKKATKHGKRAAQQPPPPPPPPAHPAPSPEWDDRIRALQQSALRERCRLPAHMACPAAGCTTQFHSPDAWDQRMEHVARHLERAAAGREGPVAFGGGGDSSLMSWCTRPDVAVVRMAAGGGAWELNSPLRPEPGRGEIAVAGAVKSEIVVESGGEEDAEGEDDE